MKIRIFLYSLSMSAVALGQLHAQNEKARPLPEAGNGTSALADHIRRAEYHYSSVPAEQGVWSAPNRSQELRSRVSANGLEVFPRATAADGRAAAWKLALRTTSFGRLDGALELGPATVCVQDERVELDHGRLLESFENQEGGIEQSWAIAARPSGTEPLWIGLHFAGDLSLRIDDGARSALLVDADGKVVLRYKDLGVSDATGRELAARLSSSPLGVGIEIDDAEAIYPLTVDPLLTGPAWTAESDQASALFGYSVSTAGDVNGDGYSDVIVGAFEYDNGQTDEGRAYVYLGSATGLSTSPAWTAESDQAGANFGLSVATAGDVNGDGYSDVIVGAPTYDNGEADEGRAYVYLGSAAGLAANPAWTAEADQAGAQFGYAVATAGDVNGDGYSDVIAGAYLFDDGESDEGRAHVYLGSATGLSASPAWTAESNQATAHFGLPVSTAGDVNGDGYSDVIVGAYLYDSGQTDGGRAYVYLGSAIGLATSPAWTAEGDQAFAFFGWSVSTAGDVNGDGYSDVILGAFLYDNGQTDEGRAYVYLGSAAGLAANPAWTAESDQDGAFFGWSVSTAGDVNGDGYSDVIVGAYGYDGGLTDEGRAHVYLGSPSGLPQTPSWTAESDQYAAEFGTSVSSAGDVNGDGYGDVIVGATLFDNGQNDEGRAFVYQGSALGLATDSAWTAESDQAGADYGLSVSTAGDVNGDGYSDVLVGARFFDNGETDEGRAFLYLGSASGLAASPAWTAESDQAGALFGEVLASAGDVNGDGYSDVIVGAPVFANGQVDEGRAFVYLGSASGLGTSPAWTAESNQAGAAFGLGVASAGDVNGDGYGDVLVGARLFDNGQTDEGRAFLYLGSASGLAPSAAWSVEANQAGAQFGEAVATAGDVNGDGYSDVLVGARLFDHGETDEGRAFLYLGSASGLATSPAWSVESNQTGAALGQALASAGDVNGDGYSDVLVGAPTFDDGETDEGRALLYLGSPSGLATSAAWSAESDQAGASFGLAVATAGDVNDDGYSDVLVSAVDYDDPEIDEGRVSLYLGSASGLSTGAGWTVEGNQSSAHLRAVSSAGDVNGDGYGDVIVGAYGYSNGETSEGRALVYLGNEGRGGLVRALQQRTLSDTRPLSIVGRTGENGLFRIRCEFKKNPVGSSWASPASPTAHLEWEVEPLGVTFDGARIERGASQSLVPAGGTLTFDELAVATDELAHARFTGTHSYHWRARVATNNPLFPHTAWFSAQGDNVTEAKLRKPELQFP